MLLLLLLLSIFLTTEVGAEDEGEAHTNGGGVILSRGLRGGRCGRRRGRRQGGR